MPGEGLGSSNVFLHIANSYRHTLRSQVFYEIHAERERLGNGGDVAIVRIEQLAPFPFDLVSRELYR